jgi:hypothetical protein
MADFAARLDDRMADGNRVFTIRLELSDRFVKSSLSKWGDVSDDEVDGVMRGWFSNRIQDCVPDLDAEMERLIRRKAEVAVA